MNTFKKMYQKDKTQIAADKYNRAHNSFIRHPIKHTKKHTRQLSKDAHAYWQEGQQLGRDRLNHKTQYIYSDKQITDYALTHTKTWQKCLYLVIALVVASLILYGAWD